MLTIFVSLYLLFGVEEKKTARYFEGNDPVAD